MEKYGIHWFRRDLRIVGNPALYQNIQKHKGRVVGIFFFDSKFLARKDFSHNRFGLFLNTLKELKRDLRNYGGELLVIDALPQEGFKNILNFLSQRPSGLPSMISFNRDYEPFALRRDSKVQKLIHTFTNIELLTNRDHLIIEPHELKKSNGDYYKIYTPFSKIWLKLFNEKHIQERISFSKKFLNQKDKIFRIKWQSLFGKSDKFQDELDLFIKNNNKNLSMTLPEAGFEAALKKLKKFKQNLSKYDQNRNYPFLNATSGLSVYLKNGSISTAFILETLKPSIKSQFLKEIIWREFYYHILYHQPRVEKEAFIEKYKNIKWENSKKLFNAWKSGMTGFPLIDAGMRQLKTTGCLHNRVRMIVASFLTKDMLIDWRWGEEWFMKCLLDGDLAANNGGWQWAASTGCDAQPYFRIFNPTTQSQRFDQKGDYIRKFVPELAYLSDKEIHQPTEENRPKTYPKPIVCHSEQRKKALRIWKKKA